MLWSGDLSLLTCTPKAHVWAFFNAKNFSSNMKRLNIQVVTQDDREDFVFELELIAGMLADGLETNAASNDTTEYEFHITHIND